MASSSSPPRSSSRDQRVLTPPNPSSTPASPSAPSGPYSGPSALQAFFDSGIDDLLSNSRTPAERATPTSAGRASPGSPSKPPRPPSQGSKKRNRPPPLSLAASPPTSSTYRRVVSTVSTTAVTHSARSPSPARSSRRHRSPSPSTAEAVGAAAAASGAFSSSPSSLSSSPALPSRDWTRMNRQNNSGPLTSASNSPSTTNQQAQPSPGGAGSNTRPPMSPPPSPLPPHIALFAEARTTSIAAAMAMAMAAPMPHGTGSSAQPPSTPSIPQSPSLLSSSSSSSHWNDHNSSLMSSQRLSIRSSLLEYTLAVARLRRALRDALFAQRVAANAMASVWSVQPEELEAVGDCSCGAEVWVDCAHVTGYFDGSSATAAAKALQEAHGPKAARVTEALHDVQIARLTVQGGLDAWSSSSRVIVELRRLGFPPPPVHLRPSDRPQALAHDAESCLGALLDLFALTSALSDPTPPESVPWRDVWPTLDRMSSTDFNDEEEDWAFSIQLAVAAAYGPAADLFGIENILPTVGESLVEPDMTWAPGASSILSSVASAARVDLDKYWELEWWDMAPTPEPSPPSSLFSTRPRSNSRASSGSISGNHARNGSSPLVGLVSVPLGPDAAPSPLLQPPSVPSPSLETQPSSSSLASALANPPPPPPKAVNRSIGSGSSVSSQASSQVSLLATPPPPLSLSALPPNLVNPPGPNTSGSLAKLSGDSTRKRSFLPGWSKSPSNSSSSLLGEEGDETGDVWMNALDWDQAEHSARDLASALHALSESLAVPPTAVVKAVPPLPADVRVWISQVAGFLLPIADTQDHRVILKTLLSMRPPVSGAWAPAAPQGPAWLYALVVFPTSSATPSSLPTSPAGKKSGSMPAPRSGSRPPTPSSARSSSSNLTTSLASATWSRSSAEVFMAGIASLTAPPPKSPVPSVALALLRQFPLVSFLDYALPQGDAFQPSFHAVSEGYTTLNALLKHLSSAASRASQHGSRELAAAFGRGVLTVVRHGASYVGSSAHYAASIAPTAAEAAEVTAAAATFTRVAVAALLRDPSAWSLLARLPYYALAPSVAWRLADAIVAGGAGTAGHMDATVWASRTSSDPGRRRGWHSTLATAPKEGAQALLRALTSMGCTNAPGLGRTVFWEIWTVAVRAPRLVRCGAAAAAVECLPVLLSFHPELFADAASATDADFKLGSGARAVEVWSSLPITSWRPTPSDAAKYILQWATRFPLGSAPAQLALRIIDSLPWCAAPAVPPVPPGVALAVAAALGTIAARLAEGGAAVASGASVSTIGPSGPSRVLPAGPASATLGDPPEGPVGALWRPIASKDMFLSPPWATSFPPWAWILMFHLRPFARSPSSPARPPPPPRPPSAPDSGTPHMSEPEAIEWEVVSAGADGQGLSWRRSALLAPLRAHLLTETGSPSIIAAGVALLASSLGSSLPPPPPLPPPPSRAGADADAFWRLLRRLCDGGEALAAVAVLHGAVRRSLRESRASFTPPTGLAPAIRNILRAPVSSLGRGRASSFTGKRRGSVNEASVLPGIGSLATMTPAAALRAAVMDHVSTLPSYSERAGVAYFWATALQREDSGDEDGLLDEVLDGLCSAVMATDGLAAVLRALGKTNPVRPKAPAPPHDFGNNAEAGSQQSMPDVSESESTQGFFDRVIAEGKRTLRARSASLAGRRGSAVNNGPSLIRRNRSESPVPRWPRRRSSDDPAAGMAWIVDQNARRTPWLRYFDLLRLIKDQGEKWSSLLDALSHGVALGDAFSTIGIVTGGELALFQLAGALLSLPVSHGLAPLYWQLLCHLYLDRPKHQSGPVRSKVGGWTVFDAVGATVLLSRRSSVDPGRALRSALVTRLREAGATARAPLRKTYNAMALWLSESPTVLTGVVTSSLPPHHAPNALADVLDASMLAMDPDGGRPVGRIWVQSVDLEPAADDALKAAHFWELGAPEEAGTAASAMAAQPWAELFDPPSTKESVSSPKSVGSPSKTTPVMKKSTRGLSGLAPLASPQIVAPSPALNWMPGNHPAMQASIAMDLDILSAAAESWAEKQRDVEWADAAFESTMNVLVRNVPVQSLEVAVCDECESGEEVSILFRYATAGLRGRTARSVWYNRASVAGVRSTPSLHPLVARSLLRVSEGVNKLIATRSASVGSIWFYALLNLLSGSTMEYPPTLKLIPECVERLGRAFVAGRSGAAPRLLMTVLENRGWIPFTAHLLHRHGGDVTMFGQSWAEILRVFDRIGREEGGDDLTPLASALDVTSWVDAGGAGGTRGREIAQELSSTLAKHLVAHGKGAFGPMTGVVMGTMTVLVERLGAGVIVQAARVSIVACEGEGDVGLAVWPLIGEGVGKGALDEATMDEWLDVASVIAHPWQQESHRAKHDWRPLYVHWEPYVESLMPVLEAVLSRCVEKVGEELGFETWWNAVVSAFDPWLMKSSSGCPAWFYEHSIDAEVVVESLARVVVAGVRRWGSEVLERAWEWWLCGLMVASPGYVSVVLQGALARLPWGLWRPKESSLDLAAVAVAGGSSDVGCMSSDTWRVVGSGVVWHSVTSEWSEDEAGGACCALIDALTAGCLAAERDGVVDHAEAFSGIAARVGKGWKALSREAYAQAADSVREWATLQEWKRGQAGLDSPLHATSLATTPRARFEDGMSSTSPALGRLRKSVALSTKIGHGGAGEQGGSSPRLRKVLEVSAESWTAPSRREARTRDVWEAALDMLAVVADVNPDRVATWVGVVMARGAPGMDDTILSRAIAGAAMGGGLDAWAELWVGLADLVQGQARTGLLEVAVEALEAVSWRRGGREIALQAAEGMLGGMGGEGGEEEADGDEDEDEGDDLNRSGSARGYSDGMILTVIRRALVKKS